MLMVGLYLLLQEENVAEKETQDEKPVCKDVSNYNSLILSYDDAPNYLKFNPYIRSGYRGYLTTKMCLERYKNAKFKIFEKNK
jgi:hypothetical protein